MVYEDLLTDPSAEPEGPPVTDFDENELNHMLKSKNFSASRLLTAKGALAESGVSKWTGSRKGSNSAEQSRAVPPTPPSIAPPLPLRVHH